MISLAWRHDAILLQQIPLRWWLVDELIIDKLCTLTGHRFCNHRLASYLNTKISAHTKTLPVPVDPVALGFPDWMGWPDFTDEDDEDPREED